MEELLGPSGRLSRVLPGWEHRPEQLALAREVERAFAERRTLVAEAGTGTGKTLAYLVPAVAEWPQSRHLHRHQDAAGPALPQGLAPGARRPGAGRRGPPS